MTFKQAVISGLYNYATFSGRASRAAFWWYILFSVLVQFTAGGIDLILFGEKIIGDDHTVSYAAPPARFELVATLALFLPDLAVTVRRLHDVNRTGRWVLILIIPAILTYLAPFHDMSQFFAFITIAYAIPLLIWHCRKGPLGGNRFGEEPL